MMKKLKSQLKEILPDKTIRQLRKYKNRVNISRGILIRKVKKHKQIRSKYHYKDKPKITIIIQFFNKKRNIKKIIERLRLTSAEEIIVIDDGSVDGSYKKWMKCLYKPNDFLLRCNDIYEIRTYDRAMRMAKGEYVCLIQDDDLPPPNNKWIEEAITLFENLPKLLILGGRSGINLMMPDSIDTNKEVKYEFRESIVGCKDIDKSFIYDNPHTIESKSGIPFMFTMCINRAPMFIRRSQFLKIGGINQDYAPFHYDDNEACVMAWLKGYQVGFYNCPFARSISEGGIRLFNKKGFQKQCKKNHKKIYDKYASHIANGHLKKLIDKANARLNKNKLLDSQYESR